MTGLESRVGAFDDYTLPPEALSWSTGVATRPHFHIQSHDTLAAAVRRVILEQVRHALQIQHPGHGTSAHENRFFDESVHELRKSIKRVRAVLRLIRAEIGDDRFRHDDSLLRDTARLWGPVRDAVVLAGLAEKVLPDLELDDEVKDTIVTTLQARAETCTRTARGDRQRLADTTFALNSFASRISSLPTDGPTAIPNAWKSIEPGIDRLARRVVARRDEAAAKKSTVRLHGWRRVAKYLGYQAELLAPEGAEFEMRQIERGSQSRNEKPLLVLHDQLSQLGSLLGDDHDLALLIETLGRDPDLLPDSVDAAHLFWELTRLRHDLQVAAFEIGEKLGDATDLMSAFSDAWRMSRPDE